ncbi:tetratricopeptide repeat protein [Candidatus Latescibacterota bacterium]
MKILPREKSGIPFFINVILVILLFAGCAATAPTVKITENQNEIEKIAGDFYLQGKMAEVKKDWPAAVTSYTEALQYDPDSDEIAYALAKSYLMDGKKRSSLYYTKMTVQLKPEEPAYWQLLQYLEEQENRIDKAAEALEMYLKLKPEHEINHEIKLSQYYFALGKKKEARRILLERARDDHSTADEIYSIASVLAYNRLTEEAISLYKNLIERDPLDSQAWLLLGNMYENIDRGKEAIDIYNKALEVNPDNIYFMIKIGNQCLVANNWNCALLYFEKAYNYGREKVEEEGINYLEISRTLCSVYYYAGRYSDGKAMYNSLLAAGNDDSRLYFSLGKTMTYLDRIPEAIEYFSKGFEKDVSELTEDSLYNAYLGYTRALLSEGKNEEALNLIQVDAKEHLKNSVSLKELEVSIYIRLKQFKDAISISEWLTASDPENRSHLLRLSLVYDMAGQFENAEKALLSILEITPDDPLALNNLAYMYLENTKNYSKAIDMVTQALKAEPDNGAYLDTLGWAYFLKGKYKQARKNIEKALEVADEEDKGIIFEHYGDVLVKLGKKEEAVDAYNSAVEYGENEKLIKSKIQNLE